MFITLNSKVPLASTVTSDYSYQSAQTNTKVVKEKPRPKDPYKIYLKEQMSNRVPYSRIGTMWASSPQMREHYEKKSLVGRVREEIAKYPEYKIKQDKKAGSKRLLIEAIMEVGCQYQETANGFVLFGPKLDALMKSPPSLSLTSSACALSPMNALCLSASPPLCSLSGTHSSTLIDESDTKSFFLNDDEYLSFPMDTPVSSAMSSTWSLAASTQPLAQTQTNNISLAPSTKDAKLKITASSNISAAGYSPYKKSPSSRPSLFTQTPLRTKSGSCRTTNYMDSLPESYSETNSSTGAQHVQA